MLGSVVPNGVSLGRGYMFVQTIDVGDAMTCISYFLKKCRETEKFDWCDAYLKNKTRWYWV